MISRDDVGTSSANNPGWPFYIRGSFTVISSVVTAL
ncbi:predicted protein [Plenodomus lingam JN3]|uniref:Predicted protein n=1 Tax=Leptosphaeria maculans (strain JN3 / isolate v23.1.3 / race Av1-4-5-6-7-8) TaxID=985895 RepID=E4ZKE4_LEPMJ|nr:predicted protein [Plenodomus lingam JN3]CBX91739.1 predicted protein [Plenodomus lingam JN3]